MGKFYEEIFSNFHVVQAGFAPSPENANPWNHFLFESSPDGTSALSDTAELNIFHLAT